MSEREWVIYRSSTHTLVYTGIHASSSKEALDKFLEGAGEQQPGREKWSDWKLEAVDVRK